MDDPILDDLRDLTEEDLEEVKKYPLIRKIILFISAIFLLFILLTYFLPGNIFSILEGKLESEKLSDFVIELDSGRVVFPPIIYEELQQIYLDNQKTEVKVCLIGEKVNNNYYISDLEIPVTLSQSVFSVSAQPCTKDAIISMHTHPYPRCLESEQDHTSHQNFKEINPEGLSALMCEPDRFNFFGA